MAKAVKGTAKSKERREESLSRERIIEASIALLDESGEAGLTFRALSERLATGPGAIYWHVANKRDLLMAACDAIVARTMAVAVVGRKPEAKIRALALGLFDTMDAHPWVGSALAQSLGQSPIIRIFEPLGQQVRAMGVADKDVWAAVSALLAYILSVSAQNAVNAQYARERGIDREEFLGAMAKTWAELDAEQYPFARSVAARMPGHDDRADYVAGVDLILRGVKAR